MRRISSNFCLLEWSPLGDLFWHLNYIRALEIQNVKRLFKMGEFIEVQGK